LRLCVGQAARHGKCSLSFAFVVQDIVPFGLYCRIDNRTKVMNPRSTSKLNHMELTLRLGVPLADGMMHTHLVLPIKW